MMLTFSWNYCRVHETETGFPTASVSGRLELKRPIPTRLFRLVCSTARLAAENRHWSRLACCPGSPTMFCRCTSKRLPTRPNHGCSTGSASGVPDCRRTSISRKRSRLLRRGQGIARGGKVLIVLDQFEQWLHSKGQQREHGFDPSPAPMRRRKSPVPRDGARRFLDGRDSVSARCGSQTGPGPQLRRSRFVRCSSCTKSAQSVWAGIRRLAGIREGNHGGRATIPGSSGLQAFRKRAKSSACGLALFAEMMKANRGQPDSLKAVGGTEGVGVTFLEEMFSAPPPTQSIACIKRRLVRVLKALLPESGTDIKGHMRLVPRTAGGLWLPESPEGVRGLDPHFGWRNPADHAHRPGRDDADDGEQSSRCRAQSTIN